MALVFSSKSITCQNPRPLKCPNFKFNQFSLEFPHNSSLFSSSTDLKLRLCLRAFSNSVQDPARSGVEDDEVKDVGVTAALSMLKFCKRDISPLLPNGSRYVPTCSEYSRVAYKKYGVAKGTILTAWRLCRCNLFWLRDVSRDAKVTHQRTRKQITRDQVD